MAWCKDIIVTSLLFQDSYNHWTDTEWPNQFLFCIWINESFANDLLVGLFYSFTEASSILDWSTLLPQKNHILRTSKAMFEEILPVKWMILSALIPYFQWKLTVNWAGNLWPRRNSSRPAKAFQIEHVRGENLKLVSVPVTRNSETVGNPSLKMSASSSEEAGHLHNCTPKIGIQAKTNSSHNTSIMLWLQPHHCHPQNMKFLFYHQHFPQMEWSNTTPPFSISSLVTF